MQLNWLNLNKAGKQKKKNNSGDREDSEYYLGEGATALPGLKQLSADANQPFRPGVKFWKSNYTAAPTISWCPPCFPAHPSWAPGQGIEQLLLILEPHVDIELRVKKPNWEQESSPGLQGREVQGVLWFGEQAQQIYPTKPN